MNRKNLRAWLTVIIILEVGVTLMAFSAMGKRRATTPGEGNKIARLVMDTPSTLESFIFYFVLGHLLIGCLLFVAWLVTRYNAKHK